MQPSTEQLQFYLGDESGIKEMANLPAEQPFAEGRIEFLNKVSMKLLSDKEAKVYPDVVTYAFWIRRSNLEKMKREFCLGKGFRMGRGLVFHIAPSNVAVNYAYSFTVGFLLGNANLVRLPSRDFPQVEIINRAIQKTLDGEEGYKRWKSYLIFLRYERNEEINDYFSSICDVRVIWGGDDTIREIRKSELPPRATEITFADRYSICIIEASQYLKSSEKEQNKVALNFYNDTYLTDQNACTSPRLICWRGELEEIRQAKEYFWTKLWKVVSEKYEFQPVQYVDKWTNVCLAAVAMDGIKVVQIKDNQIVRVQLEQLDVLVQEYRSHSGFFYEYDLKDIMELIPLCNTKLQTIALLGNSEKLAPLIHSGVKGIDRVVKIGKTMEFGMIWDGYDLGERLTREIRKV